MEAFQEKYFPERVQHQMEADFLKLTQGMKSVAEYEEQFMALSRFDPTLVVNEGSKCRKFLEGLCTNIKGRLTILKLNNYADLVDRAILVEKDIFEAQATRDQRNKKIDKADNEVEVPMVKTMGIKSTLAEETKRVTRVFMTPLLRRTFPLVYIVGRGTLVNFIGKLEHVLLVEKLDTDLKTA